MALALLLSFGLAGTASPQGGDSSYDSDYRAAAEAFDSARHSLDAGELRAAEQQFARARRLAPAHSELHRRASEQLDYRLPLHRVQRLVFSGHTAAAERDLRDLLATHGDDPERRAELEQILARLKQDLHTPPPAGTGDGRAMLKQLRDRLDAFRRVHDRFPSGYRELNAALPAGQPPLDRYEIVEYRATDGGYRMLLRSKTNPENTLTVQKTGLLR